MKAPFFRSAAAVFLTAILAAHGAYATGLLPNEAKFAPDERVLPDGSVEGTHRGVLYVYWRDGSAVVQGHAEVNLSQRGYPSDDTHWHIRCSKSSMTDRVLCSALRGNIALSAMPDGSFYVSVPPNDFPGRPAMVRVDSNTAHVGEPPRWNSYSGKLGKKLVTEMLAGTRMAVRHHKWPHDEAVESSIRLYGLAQAIDYLKWAQATAGTK